MSPQGDGSRTEALVSMAGRLLASGMTPDEVTLTCLGWNRSNAPPLDESKVIATCASLAQTDARNHPERASRFAALMEDSGPPTPLFAIVDASIGTFLTTPPQRRRWVLDDFLPLGITAIDHVLGDEALLFGGERSHAGIYPGCGKVASRQWKDKNSGERQEETEWHRVTLFDRLAEIAAEYLKKGRPVYIEGRLKTRKYTDKDGIEKYTTDIIATEMQLLGGREGGAESAESAPRKTGPERQPQAPAPKATARAPVGFGDIEDDDIPF